MYTLGDVARRSLTDEDLLYRLFGVNAELLIDHTWGWEPVTLADIKGYRPEKSSMGAGQVLSCPYPADKARLVVREMADALALDLVQSAWWPGSWYSPLATTGRAAPMAIPAL